MTVAFPPGAAQFSPHSATPSVHCGMCAVDIAAFSSRDDDSVQLHLRESLYRILEEAAASTGLPWTLCYHEDRGDGLFLIAPAFLGAEVLLDPFIAYVRAGVRRHNKLASETAKIRMRMAVHAGYTRLDAHGAAGNALIHLFRLLDCLQLKDTLENSGGEFVLMASSYLFDEVIRHGVGLLDPAGFQPITITCKETHSLAWLWLPAPPPGNGYTSRHARPASSAIAQSHQLPADVLPSGR